MYLWVTTVFLQGGKYSKNSFFDVLLLSRHVEKIHLADMFNSTIIRKIFKWNDNNFEKEC